MVIELVFFRAVESMVGFLVYAFAGWMFLCSPQFRRQTRDRWERQGQALTVRQIAGGALGVTGTVALLAGLGVAVAGLL
jgi:hypothetical protein